MVLRRTWNAIKNDASRFYDGNKEAAINNNLNANISRRDWLKLMGGAGYLTFFGEETLGAGADAAGSAAGAAGDAAGEVAPDIEWKFGPFGKTETNEVTPTETTVTPSQDTPTPTTDTPTPTPEPVTPTMNPQEMAESYTLDQFVDDLHDQGEHSVEVTEALFTDAYRLEGDIVSADITPQDEFLVNDIGANLYSGEPSLDYTTEFGNTLKLLDEHDELTGIVDSYVEEEMGL